MRHVLGFVIGVVLAALGVGLALVGVGALPTTTADLAGDTTGHVLLVVAGVVLGLLAASRRLSPLSPLVGGLLVLAAGILLWVRPGAAADVDLSIAELQAGAVVAARTGAFLVLGPLLVVLALVPQGRRRARGDDGRDDDGFVAVPPAAPQSWSAPGR